MLPVHIHCSHKPHPSVLPEQILMANIHGHTSPSAASKDEKLKNPTIPSSLSFSLMELEDCVHDVSFESSFLVIYCPFYRVQRGADNCHCPTLANQTSSLPHQKHCLALTPAGQTQPVEAPSYGSSKPLCLLSGCSNNVRTTDTSTNPTPSARRQV